MIEPALNPEGGFRRLRIDCAYDGTNFAGWAIQPDQRTIQGVIEGAISKLVRAPVTTVVAGRTDAGVHAIGQVLHVDLSTEFEPSRYRPEENIWDFEHFKYRLNQMLDEDIRILIVSEAPLNFDARFTAIARHYRYKLLDGNKNLLPLQRFDVATWFRPLDIDLMNQASRPLLGKHDFLTFCKYREGAPSIRTLLEFDWSRDRDGFVICNIAADGFGWNMVRNLVGAAVCVGEGRFPITWMEQILSAKSRISDSYVFPARGLTLVQVDYPSAEILAEISLADFSQEASF
ncbi:MAG: tRNA pseudouridine(38-40) synthase TruA [Actinomycetota bacterium]